VSQGNLLFEMGLSPGTSFVADSLFIEFSHLLCVYVDWYGLLVVSLLCDMGIPKEDTPRACAAHTIYLRWVAFPTLNYCWMALVGFCVVVGIVASAAAKFSTSTLQITLSMSAVTNLAHSSHRQVNILDCPHSMLKASGSWSDIMDPACSIACWSWPHTP
jgi:hypothetical protein